MSKDSRVVPGESQIQMSQINRGADFDYLPHHTAPPEKPRMEPVEPEENKFIKYVRPCIAEMLQLIIFVFIGTLSVANLSAAFGVGVIGIAIAHGLTIALLVAGFGGISGAHINPAVTLGVTLAGGLKPVMAIPYVLSQLVGAIIGAGLMRGVLGESSYIAINGGAHTLPEGISVGEGLLCEVVVTMVLVGSVLLTAVDSDGKNPHAPFAIGFSVLVDIMAAGTISGASMNPARSFGPTMILSAEGVDTWGDHWVYWVGPALGSLLAAAFYRLLFARPDKRLILKPT